MFDSVIRPAQFRQSRWGSGFVVAVAAHAASLALAIYLSKRPAEPTRQEVDVKFVKAPPPPPPPPSSSSPQNETGGEKAGSQAARRDHSAKGDAKREATRG